MRKKCKHTDAPEGYIQWHTWAAKKSLTHKQVKCPDCGLLAIWVKRESLNE